MKPGTHARRTFAFTLIELMVVIAIIAVIAGLLLPSLSRAKESGRSGACLSNLHQIGIALQLYVEDNDNRMPEMRDKIIGGDPATNTLPSPNIVLSNYLGAPSLLRCPSDKQQAFELTGSSYSWNSLVNKQSADHLTILNLPLGSHHIPLFFDKEKFHSARGKGKEMNFLYADGHIKNLLELEGTK